MLLARPQPRDPRRAPPSCGSALLRRRRLLGGVAASLGGGGARDDAGAPTSRTVQSLANLDALLGGGAEGGGAEAGGGGAPGGGAAGGAPRAALRAPLRLVGGAYPSLALRLPDAATAKQRARGESGVTFDLVLDTASSVNTLSAQVASELGLEVVGEQPAGVSAAGALPSAPIYLLGDVQLGDVPKEERQGTFMTGLQAASLPVATPASAGVLGAPFFACFEGVEMDFGDAATAIGVQQAASNTNSTAANANVSATAAALVDAPPRPAAVTFYAPGAELPEDAVAGTRRVALQPLPESALPTVELAVGGGGPTVTALLDTGSPVTILNQRAAEVLGISVSSGGEQAGGGNFLSRAAARMRADPADTLYIAGADGQPVTLRRSVEEATLELMAADSDADGTVRLGSTKVYVGEIPGLAALGDLDKADGAAILGMDALRQCGRLIYCARTNELLVPC